MNGSGKSSRIEELLNMAELPGSFIHRYPSKLSGGEKQRICIAWALAVDPDLIFCDDVISPLDQLVAEGVLKPLQHLRPELGVSFPFITHDLATIKAIADEIILMLNGRIVEPGNRNPVLNPPHHEYNELPLSSIPEMDPEWLDRVLEEREVSDPGFSNRRFRPEVSHINGFSPCRTGSITWRVKKAIPVLLKCI
jgi:peptide/nickel transport system ATP-binding protein